MSSTKPAGNFNNTNRPDATTADPDFQTVCYPEKKLRTPEQRRSPPDRGIVLLDAKERLGPQIWALYGRVDVPVVLKDDLYLDNRFNDFYRDNNGHAFLLLPAIVQDPAARYEVADAAFRRAVALGVTENPIIFFTCVYQMQLPDYCCVDIHTAAPKEVLPEEKCRTLLHFEQARLGDEMGEAWFSVDHGKKMNPVTIHCAGATSINLEFALNTLVLHHGYLAGDLQGLWD